MTDHNAKKYCLVMPDSLYEKVHDEAKEQTSSVRGVLMRFVKLGLFLEEQLKEDPNSVIVIRKSDGSETVVKIV